MATAALFDMDRTLIRKDTATLYTKYQRDIGAASLHDVLRVAYWIFRYKLGVIDAEAVALEALRAFKGKEEAWLASTCEKWFSGYVLPHVCEKGRQAVKRHRDRGDFIAIVTSATAYAAKPLARELGIDHVVCTELVVDDKGCFTGQIRSPLCYGAGKIELARRIAETHDFALEEASFYSDSITDLPLLEQVRSPVVVNPDARLRMLARRRGWPVETW
jgi:HAD superfamily hydrolase (TIGR01490 family)